MSENGMQWRKGLRDGIPIALGYLAVSFSFGIVAKKAGLTAFQGSLMSVTNLTSAGQFAALGLIASSASYWEMAVTQLVINLRYCLMACALSQKLDERTPFWHRFPLAFGITDEIFGVSVIREGKLNPFYNYGLMSVAIPGWTLGTFLGIVSGGLLTPRITSALGVAIYGMFLAVIVPPAREKRVLSRLIPLSMLASLLFAEVPLFAGMSPGLKIIVLTVLIAGGAAILFPVGEEPDEG